MQGVLQRPGTLQHQRHVPLPLRELELVLRVFGVEVLQLQLRGGEGPGETIEILLSHGNVTLRLARPVAGCVDIRLIDVGFL